MRNPNRKSKPKHTTKLKYIEVFSDGDFCKVQHSTIAISDTCGENMVRGNLVHRKWKLKRVLFILNGDKKFWYLSGRRRKYEERI